MFYSFIFGFAESSLLHGLFPGRGKWGLLSNCSIGASHCRGFSRCGAQALGSQAPGVVAPGLQSTGSVERSGLTVSLHVESSRTRDRTCVSCIAGGVFTADPPRSPPPCHFLKEAE